MSTPKCRFLLLLLPFLALGSFESRAATAGPSRSWAWFEAEESGTDGTPELSGGRMVWVRPGTALERDVEIPAAGTWTLWVRKFWNPQAFRWRFGDAAEWHEVRESTLTDLLLIGGQAGQRVGWFNAGSVALPAGSRRFRLEVPAAEKGTTAYDCFLLTTSGFSPRGALKPGEKSGAAEAGWFAFEPEPDSFTESPVDLRRLNERTAGDEGFIRVRGEGFVHEKTGRDARFWGVNVGMGFVGSAPGEIATFARGMAKRGVNLVRVHGPIYETSGPRFGVVDARRVTQLRAFIAALKREGIYTSLSIYFPLWVTPGPDNPAFPGYARGQHPFGLPYFSAEFQRLYREWWRALLAAPAPDTGLALRDDPAVAFAEMINEDSTLFWTFNPADPAKSNLPEPQRALLERQFGEWLRRQHPEHTTLEAIREHVWAGLAVPADSFATGRVGFRPLWEMFNRRTPRDQDTARFLTGLMTEFHRGTYDFLRKELGFRGLIYCSNWKTASPQFLDPLDKQANAVGDFFDRHGYFEGPHEGPNATWNLEPNQTYEDRCALRFRRPDGRGDDFENPVFDLIYNGRPSIITEINWPLPNRLRADMVLFGACYGALQGTDALVWFAADAPAWDGLPGKFSIQTPTILGQFPGAALIYRQGLVKTGPRVVDVQVPVKDLFELRGTPVPAPQNFDSLRGAEVPPGGTITNRSAVDSLAFLVGRVGIDLVVDGEAKSRAADLGPFLDRGAKRVRSQTGELELDWGAGRLFLRAAAAQGITGFLRTAGRVDLPDVSVESSMEYGALLVVSLDDLPIRQARRILVQVASEERPWQWTTEPAEGRRKITNRGARPLMVRHFAGAVRLQRPDARALLVTPLDYNGYPTAVAKAIGGDGTFSLATETPAYLVEAPQAGPGNASARR